MHLVKAFGVASVLTVVLSGCCVPMSLISLVKKKPPAHAAAEQKEAAAEKAEGSQKFCPVMDAKVNKDMFVEHQDKRIKVCCSACLPEVRKEPNKYMEKLEAEGITLEPAHDKADETESSHSGHSGCM